MFDHPRYKDHITNLRRPTQVAARCAECHDPAKLAALEQRQAAEAAPLAAAVAAASEKHDHEGLRVAKDKLYEAQVRHQDERAALGSFGPAPGAAHPGPRGWGIPHLVAALRAHEAEMHAPPPPEPTIEATIEPPALPPLTGEAFEAELADLEARQKVEIESFDAQVGQLRQLAATAAPEKRAELEQQIGERLGELLRLQQEDRDALVARHATADAGAPEGHGG